jgi:hypothetical protein
MKIIAEIRFLFKFAVFFLILGLVLGLVILFGAPPVETSPIGSATPSSSLCNRSY